MSLETVFSVATAAAAVGWLGLLAFPRARLVTWWLSGVGLPGALALLYVAVLATHWPADDARAGFGSLAGVEALFSHRGAVLGGWVHYLAFDLFVGAWEARRAAERRLPWLLLAPCLMLTFLFGPAGLALFLVVCRPRGEVAR